MELLDFDLMDQSPMFVLVLLFTILGVFLSDRCCTFHNVVFYAAIDVVVVLHLEMLYVHIFVSGTSIHFM